MKVAIVNASSEVYNLATHRIAHYHEALGDEVTIINPIFDPSKTQKGMSLFLPEIWNAEKYYFSAIFTWDLPGLVQAVNLVKDRGIPLEIGGPAATALPLWIEEQTGIKPCTGLDQRFEHVPGQDYKAIFTSRGCPRACEFCIVQAVEGRKMIEYDDFSIPVGENPWVCDNNILACSWEHQQLMVAKLKNVRNLDLNSGFDDRIFARDPEKYYNLYSQLHLERWRFAYDKPDQKEPLTECVNFLHSRGIKYSNISIFCLVGWPGTTPEEGREKLQYLCDIGTSPYAMRYRPLDSLTRDYVPPRWAQSDMDVLFGYFNVPWVWRTSKFEDFKLKYVPPVENGTIKMEFPDMLKP